MAYAAALSEHPVPAHATGEVVGELYDRLGAAPDLVTLFVTAPLAGALEDIVRTVRTVLNPRVLLGSSAVSVLGGAREVEDVAAIALFGARWGVDVTPARLEVHRGPEGELLVAGGSGAWGEGALLLLADPFSFPTEDVLAGIAAGAPDLPVIGGMASAARAPGGNVLVLDDETFRHGAVGVHLPAEVPVRTVVSQGCRPFGQPFVVTRSEGNVISELGGRPALDRLMEQIEALGPEDRALAASGLHAGLVIDERKTDFRAGDFLVRGVLGADREAGAVAIGAPVEPGTTVQFQVRDAASADTELSSLVADATEDAALVFTCNGRGSRLFGAPDHDAATVSEALRGGPLAGMFCAGEVGPVGGRNHLHGFTASIALFG